MLKNVKGQAYLRSQVINSSAVGDHPGTIRNSYHKLRLSQTRFRLKITQNDNIINLTVH